MHTTATLHVHPAAATTVRIFEVRRLALQSGCAFVTTKRRAILSTARPFDPNDGGRAA